MSIKKGYIFSFGKHKGESIEEVMNTDISYVWWCNENVEGFDTTELSKQAIEELIKNHVVGSCQESNYREDRSYGGSGFQMMDGEDMWNEEDYVDY